MGNITHKEGELCTYHSMSSKRVENLYQLRPVWNTNMSQFTDRSSSNNNNNKNNNKFSQ